MAKEKMMILDGDVMREYTEAEYAQNAKDIADASAIRAEEDAKAAELAAEEAATKAPAIAKLEALGLTADDLKALGF
jgi:hypothetical protein